MDTFPTLQSRRLVLREIVPSDAAALYAIHSDTDAMRWFGTDPLSNLQQAEQLVETFAAWRKTANPGTRWGIVEHGAHQLLGTCGLFKWNRAWKSCTIGYELSRDARGKGLMHEALSMVLAWGFEHMSLNRVEAQIHPENHASIKLATRLGFVCEGRLREAGFWLGAHRDLLQYALLRADYAAAPPATPPSQPRP